MELDTAEEANQLCHWLLKACRIRTDVRGNRLRIASACTRRRTTSMHSSTESLKPKLKKAKGGEGINPVHVFM